MSALCQKRTFCAAVKTSLFDHLVGDGEQQLQDIGRLPRRAGRLFAFEDAIDVSDGTAELVGHFICNSVRTELFAFYE
jgi:hypothetical protein